MFKVLLLSCLSTSAVFAQVLDAQSFRKKIPQRLEKMRLAHEKSQEVIDAVLNLAQENEEAQPQLSQFYYEMAEAFEAKSEAQKLDVHRFMVSEFSPYLKSIEEGDAIATKKWSEKVANLDQKYFHGQDSYKTWFAEASSLNFRFDERSCSNSVKEKLSKSFLVGFSENQIHVLNDAHLIKNWLLRGELKINCLAERTDYSGQVHTLSIGTHESFTKIKKLLSPRVHLK